METAPGVHLIFVEEPEVHLHPQMQEVFIRKLGENADVFSKELGASWPVQFIVSTHSSHVANEAHFETIRYFLMASDDGTGALKTVAIAPIGCFGRTTNSARSWNVCEGLRNTTADHPPNTV
jgi:predicted ATP-binding protein involved in virulence